MNSRFQKYVFPVAKIKKVLSDKCNSSGLQIIISNYESLYLVYFVEIQQSNFYIFVIYVFFLCVSEREASHFCIQ